MYQSIYLHACMISTNHQLDLEELFLRVSEVPGLEAVGVVAGLSSVSLAGFTGPAGVSAGPATDGRTRGRNEGGIVSLGGVVYIGGHHVRPSDITMHDTWMQTVWGGERASSTLTDFIRDLDIL